MSFRKLFKFGCLFFSMESFEKVRKNLFISFEGIDGCGKDTQLYNLLSEIKEDGNKLFGDKYSNVWVTREPTKITESGLKIANLMREGDVSKEDTTKYFISDRIEHSRIIEDVIKHSFVLVSRYDLSTLSYQMSQGMDFEELYNLHKFGLDDGCIIPDVTIVFDVPVSVAMDRIGSRDSPAECFEKEDFLLKVRENLMFCIEELRKKDGRKIIVVDGSESIEEVKEEMVEKLIKLFE